MSEPKGNRSTLPYVLLILLLSITLRSVQAQQALTPADGRYRLHKSDVIQVSFHLTPELDSSVVIQPDGFATIPNIGDVHLLNLTLDQATAEITAKAEQRLNKPEITVSLKDFERPHFFAGGEVGRPGKYNIEGPLSALQAIQIAGGLKDTAQASKVLLLHPIADGMATTRIIDLKHLEQTSNRSAEIEVQSGDILIVKENTFTRVQRVVKLVNPGVYVPLGGQF